jgi:predicted Na+-dependent transporter
MSDILQIAGAVLKVSVVAFMVGNLLAIGLETDLKAALAPLRDVRFVVTATLLDWLLCPAFAWLITRLLPIALPYATGLLLIGLAPAAPFLPMMVRRAGGDLAYTAAFMLIAAVGTVLLMPLAVPVIVPGLSVDPWTLAKPLLVLLFLPMAAGIAIKTVAPSLAVRLLRIVRPASNAATLLLLAAIGVRYFEGFVGAVGSYAVAAQLLYAVGLVLGAHAVGAGLPAGQRRIVVGKIAQGDPRGRPVVPVAAHAHRRPLGPRHACCRCGRAPGVGLPHGRHHCRPRRRKASRRAHACLHLDRRWPVVRTVAGRGITRWFERSFLGGLPQYQMMKSMAEGLAQVEQADGVSPALVCIEEGWQIGYLLEPLAQGWVAVFLPQAPTPVSGNVMYLPAERVRLSKITMTEAMAIVKRMGIGSAAALRDVDLTLPEGVGA